MQTRLARAGVAGQAPHQSANPAPAATPSRNATGKDRQFVTALSRGLEILRCFGPDRPELTATEIARLTRLPYPTVWRLCHTLAESGYIVYSEKTGRMGLGVHVLSLGFAVLRRYRIADIALPLMQAVTDRLQIGMTLSTRDGLDVVYLQRCHGNFVHMNNPVGSRLPIATTGTGWAYLAGASEQERRQVLDALRKADPKAWPRHKANIEGALKEYQRTGLVFNLRVLHPEMHSVAVPIRSADGRQVFGLSASGLASTWSKAKLKPVGLELIEIAKALAPTLAGTEGVA